MKETIQERDARLDRERAAIIAARADAAGEGAESPLEKFARVWKGESNSGNVKLKGV